MEGMLGPGVTGMSGRHKQKVACASMSKAGPNVIVLVKLSGNLDARAIADLRHIVGTHDPEFARAARLPASPIAGSSDGTVVVGKPWMDTANMQASDGGGKPRIERRERKSARTRGMMSVTMASPTISSPAP